MAELTNMANLTQGWEEGVLNGRVHQPSIGGFAELGSDQKRRARKAAMAAFSLAPEASNRTTEAQVTAEVEASGYDLAVPARVPSAVIEE